MPLFETYMTPIFEANREQITEKRSTDVTERVRAIRAGRGRPQAASAGDLLIARSPDTLRHGSAAVPQRRAFFPS